MDVHIRRAQPTDVDAAVPLIYSSGPDAFRFVFESPGRSTALAFLRSAFVDGAGEFGYRNHRVAIAGTTVVGIAAGWGAESNFSFMRAAARQIFSTYGGLRAWGVIVRGLRAESIIKPPIAGRWYIAHLGVDPAQRSAGVGAALLGDQLSQARSAGKSHAALDVAVTNPRAQSLYERLGFAVMCHRPSTLNNACGHVPGMHYMERPLD